MGVEAEDAQRMKKARHQWHLHRAGRHSSLSMFSCPCSVLCVARHAVRHHRGIMLGDGERCCQAAACPAKAEVPVNPDDFPIDTL
ncbi:MAG: hypothetical protein J6T92_06730 [Ottowia sp.]|nr:hypothetical protein [Ottowia sp.]